MLSVWFLCLRSFPDFSHVVGGIGIWRSRWRTLSQWTTAEWSGWGIITFDRGRVILRSLEDRGGWSVSVSRKPSHLWNYCCLLDGFAVQGRNHKGTSGEWEWKTDSGIQTNLHHRRVHLDCHLLDYTHTYIGPDQGTKIIFRSGGIGSEDILNIGSSNKWVKSYPLTKSAFIRI